MAKEVEKKEDPGSYEPDNVTINYSEDEEDAKEVILPDVVDIVVGEMCWTRSKDYDPANPFQSRNSSP